MLPTKNSMLPPIRKPCSAPSASSRELDELTAQAALSAPPVALRAQRCCRASRAQPRTGLRTAHANLRPAAAQPAWHASAGQPLLGALIVAVTPIATAGALPAIVLIGATCGIAGGTGDG